LSPSRWAANITLGELGVAGMAARSSVTSQLSTRFEVLTQYLFFASIDTVHLPRTDEIERKEKDTEWLQFEKSSCTSS